MAGAVLATHLAGMARPVHRRHLAACLPRQVARRHLTPNCRSVRDTPLVIGQHALVAERLIEVVARMRDIPKGDRYEVGPALYARRPFGAESEAMVRSEEPVEEWASPSAPDFTYVLGVETAKEVLEVWSSWRDGQVPTPTEAVAAIVYYALNDAYQPIE
jgi:hypothetical protein